MRRSVVALSILGLAVGFVALVAMAQTPSPEAPPSPAPKAQTDADLYPPQPAGPEKFRGTLVNQGGALSRFFQAGYFTLQIDKYSPDEDVKTLMVVLKNEGQQGVLEKLWKMKQIGFLKVGGSMGYPILFARTRPVAGGRVVRALTNRPIVPAEFGGRSENYPFGFIEIFLPDHQKGTGSLIPMAMVGFTTQGTLAVESYGTMPYRLLDVALDVKKKK